jgi:hypothetical protein
LSPNLFGLFLDGFEGLLKEVPGADAPSLAGLVVPLLLYADDLVLISTTQSGLQRLMDRLERFCEDRRLTVNIEKTKTLVFGARKRLKTPITLKGMPIEHVVFQISRIDISPKL